MNSVIFAALTLCLAFVFQPFGALRPGSFRLIRSLSGPSGKIVGSKFVFDEMRNRFVYPHDKSLIVYFEWQASPGNHALTGLWKDPQGRTAFISSDIKMETATSELNAYWTYEISPGVSGGIWTLEVRIDGEPAGSHSFELVVPEEPKPSERPAPPAQPKLPSLDELYRSVIRSLVWVHKLDEKGRRTDTASGFVIAGNQVATAFQAIDTAVRIEIEFTPDRRVTTDELWTCQRLEDWALIKVDTGETPALSRGDPDAVPIGERLVVFNVEAGLARAIGGVDVSGRRKVPAFGERIQISPSLSPEAVGGPLINPLGNVVGIIGGSLTPGARFNRRDMSVSPALWNSLDIRNGATPITAVPSQLNDEPNTLKKLLDIGVLTSAISAKPSFVYGGTTNALPKKADGPGPIQTSEFSRKDAEIWVYTMWQRKEKIGKGSLSAKVYDARNRLRVEAAPLKVALLDSVPTRFAFNFSPRQFELGVYRVDILWDSRPVWRTFISIID